MPEVYPSLTLRNQQPGVEVVHPGAEVCRASGKAVRVDVSRLAEKLGVAPAVVAGRAQRLGVVSGYFWEREEAA